jgi:hypothetical protein
VPRWVRSLRQRIVAAGAPVERVAVSGGLLLLLGAVLSVTTGLTWPERLVAGLAGIFLLVALGAALPVAQHARRWFVLVASLVFFLGFSWCLNVMLTSAGSALAITSQRPVVRVATLGAQAVEIDALSIPAGHYSIRARLYLPAQPRTSTGQQVRCTLVSTPDRDEALSRATSGASTPVALEIVHTFSRRGRAVLACAQVGVPGAGTLDLRSIRITAISVRSLVEVSST